MGRIRGLSDVFNEVTFREGALHNTRLEIMRELRQAALNPNANQNNDPAFQTLLGQYNNVLSGDFQASESLASKVTDEFSGQLLHATVGEKMAGQTAEDRGGNMFGKFALTVLFVLGSFANAETFPEIQPGDADYSYYRKAINMDHELINNHVIDSLRYAIEDVRLGETSGVW